MVCSRMLMPLALSFSTTLSQYCPAQILLVEHRRYGDTGRPGLSRISRGEGDPYGPLPACASDHARPPRLAVFSPAGAVVRSSACGRYRAGSGGPPPVIL